MPDQHPLTPRGASSRRRREEGTEGGELRPTLATIEGMYHKLGREWHRTWHARDLVHKADHFYNFSITARALCDYYLMVMQVPNRQKQEQEWCDVPVLAAVRDIANSVKHFTLNYSPKTDSLTPTTGLTVDVFQQPTGDLLLYEVEGPDIVVTMRSGEEYDLYAMLSGVNDYWQAFLTKKGVELGDDPNFWPQDQSKVIRPISREVRPGAAGQRNAP